MSDTCSGVVVCYKHVRTSRRIGVQPRRRWLPLTVGKRRVSMSVWVESTADWLWASVAFQQTGCLSGTRGSSVSRTGA
ncbi:hypothetical protein CGGC5_v000697 [Colletotrichum fructicola Nara gc5]|uniref:Uncharacterized protein n=1 Tax=Colletotrichum fructicola (strain Nara gc5) TaxID=1213859 RepID=A0A7J6JJH9_COLFN|nr:hypothetical protein CGGC5_v000697 [Colletotrichum fructicola Nara gc5]